MTGEYFEQNLDRIELESTQAVTGKTKSPDTLKAIRLPTADPKYRKKENAKNLARNNQYRTNLVSILGGLCYNPKCLVSGGCRDIRCLQLDHINGGGKVEVARFGSTPVMCCYYLKHLDEARSKLQILCANCNWIKRYENNEISRVGRPRTVIYPLVGDSCDTTV